MESHRHLSRWPVMAIAAFVVCTYGPQVPAQDLFVQPILITTEVKALEPAPGAADVFQRSLESLGAKTPTKADADAIQSTADRFKALVPDWQQRLRTLISKLKSAGKWTPELDAYIDRQLRVAGASSEFLLEVKAAGGPRASLEAGLVESSQIGSEVDIIMKNIRAKTVTSRILDTLFGVPVHAISPGTLCGLYKQQAQAAAASGDTVGAAWYMAKYKACRAFFNLGCPY